MGQNKQQRAAAARTATPAPVAAPAATPAAATTTTKPTAAPATKPQSVLDAEAELRAAKERAAKAKAEAQAAEKAAKAQAREAAKAAKVAKERRPVCSSTKKDGTACTARCVEGKDTCVDHQPAWDRLTPEEHAAFGSWLRTLRAPELVEELGWYRAKQLAREHLHGRDGAGPSPVLVAGKPVQLAA